VFPCRKGWDESRLKKILDISQIEWAYKEGKWWFIRPIIELKITKVNKEKLSQIDIDHLNFWGHFGYFRLKIEES
jgi:hypothetical protein